MQGADLVSAVRTDFVDLQVIVNTISEDSQTVFDAIRAGASGYMLKGSSPRDLIAALFELYEGGAPMSPRIARKVIAQMHENIHTDEFLLSYREKEVLQLIEQGFSYMECAKKLSISRHTVNSHIKKIYQKLHAQNKTEALTKAKQKGII
jgi:two-component system NarL family response regulator